MRNPVAIVLAALMVLVGCGGGDPEPDLDGGAIDGGATDGGAIDGGPEDGGASDGGPSCSSDPIEEGCACDDEANGSVLCMGTGGIECCHGAWQRFFDGPCYPPNDGGPPSCDTPDVGCPCDTAGEIACRTFLRWRLVCEGGVWAEDHGRICC